eukprot:Opistho-1_new@47288
MAAHEVRGLAKSLDKLDSAKLEKQDVVEEERAKDILKLLDEVVLTLELLQETNLGRIVNGLRKKTKNETIVAMSKALVGKWKRLLEDGTPAKKGAADSSEPLSQREEPKSDAGSQATSTGGSVAGSQPPATAPLNRRLSIETTRDVVRDKFREQLTLALQKKDTEANEPYLDPYDLAVQIETSVFDEFKAANDKYKNRMRSRVTNLKDARNPNLRIRILTGDISASDFAKMTADQMASESLKELRSKYEKEALDSYAKAQGNTVHTTQFRCGKCGKRDASYFQMQTRSADEPMTTFMTCNVCGNNWKFC